MAFPWALPCCAFCHVLLLTACSVVNYMYRIAMLPFGWRTCSMLLVQTWAALWDELEVAMGTVNKPALCCFTCLPPVTWHLQISCFSAWSDGSFSSLLFDFLDIIDVPVKQVGHRVSDGCVFEAWGDAKHRDIGHRGAQLSHSLTLKMQKCIGDNELVPKAQRAAQTNWEVTSTMFVQCFWLFGLSHTLMRQILESSTLFVTFNRQMS